MKRNIRMRLAGAVLMLVTALSVCSFGAKAAPVTKPDGTVFDYIFYANHYPDLMEAFGLDEGALWNHYVNHGRAEGRQTCTSPSGAETGNPQVNLSAQFPYYIMVNRAANCVTVMGMDAAGAYSIPVRAFVCSTGGEKTPLGTFTTTAGRRWGLLFGNVWGQYSTRITGSILFHSVPYLQQNATTLEYWEYNKLGTAASMGCVRLTCEDAKWIFDNCAPGTTVTIYDDAQNPGPLGKPAAPRIDENNAAYRGWDPTDPDPANPWKN